eukprot:ctg_2065.g476
MGARDPPPPRAPQSGVHLGDAQRRSHAAAAPTASAPVERARLPPEPHLARRHPRAGAGISPAGGVRLCG